MSWISVNERLPEFGVRVIAWCPKDFKHPVFARFVQIGAGRWRPEGCNGDPWVVTHWMPEPAAPSGAEAPQDKKEGR